jgi:hypothetical protein
MTVGMKTIRRIKQVERQALRLGFEFVESIGSHLRTDDEISLAVIEETLPALRNGVQVFSGNLDEVEAFMNGLDWARWYDIALGLQTDDRRAKSEQKVRNKKLLNTIKDS